jgi:hypothetical protein
MAVFKNAVFYPETANFIQAAGITDETQMKAIGRLVGDLKFFNLWDKMKAVYPFVGGTSGSHRFNLKDPRDTNAAYRLAFTGTWYHTSQGISGSNAYAQTYFNPGTALDVNSAHISIYSTLPSTTFTVGSKDRFFVYLGVNTRLLSSTGTSATLTNTTGLFTFTKTTGIETTIIQNNSILVANNTQTPANPDLGSGVLIGARSDGTLASPSPLDYATGNYAFVSIGDGFTTTEAANLYTAVQRFQTTLGRQV